MQAIVVSPNQEDRDHLGFVLRQGGLGVISIADLAQVKSVLQSQTISLVLIALDDGAKLRELVENWRAISQVLIVAVVEPLSEQAHCDLLDIGVDLVVERPYSPRLLRRYIRVLLQRVQSLPVSVLPGIEIDNVYLDPASRTITIDQHPPQRLTELEFRLLYVLMTNSGQVIPTDVIVERVWGYSGEGNRDLVRGLVRRLRRKIEPIQGETRYIHTLPGVGYRFFPE
ncbi:MAG: DNA-binding response regulator [Chloroflexi bacterium]|nr:MAG: DNA-binding response regulator [Chloroflexota bacterium]